MTVEKFQLRAPTGLLAVIRRRAAANRRSINSECLVLLEQGLLADRPSESPESLAALLPRATLSETAP